MFPRQPSQIRSDEDVPQTTQRTSRPDAGISVFTGAGDGIVITGQRACRTVASATLPSTARETPSRVTAAAADLGAGLEVTTATTSGVPAHAICAYAQRIGADLIVMGTHGRTGVSRAVLGSVAEATVRHARCPVMTIPSPAPVKTEMPASGREVRCVVCGTS